MATNTVSIICTNTSNTTFRAWGSLISAQLAATCGLVKTADAGQIDWSSVATPPNPTVAGYEMWRFNDALQSVAPIVVKVEYQTFNGIAGIGFTLASGSDGTGNLLGPASLRVVVQPGAVPAVNGTGYFAGAGSWFHVTIPNADNGGSPGGFHLGIERTKDASGMDTPMGALMTTFQYNKWSSMGYDCQLGQPFAWEPALACMVPLALPSVLNGVVPVYPVFCIVRGIMYDNPGLNLYAYFSGHIANGTPTTMTVYGQSHTYMPVQWFSNVSTRVANLRTTLPLVRWE